MKKEVIALRLHSGEIKIEGMGRTKLNLPKGCTGIMFTFESKKTARKYWGNKVGLVEIETKEIKK